MRKGTQGHREGRGSEGLGRIWTRRIFSFALALTGCASVSKGPNASGYWVGERPPEPLRESIPPPLGGYAWVPGYWELNAGAWAWVSGRLYPLAFAASWVPPRCTPRRSSCWYVPGHWERAKQPPAPQPEPRAETAANPRPRNPGTPALEAQSPLSSPPRR